jgi:hypothetical protein
MQAGGWSRRHHASSAWGGRRGLNPRTRGHGPVLCLLSYDHHGPQRRTRTSDTGRIRPRALTLSYLRLVRTAGLEPATPGLGSRRSVLLSYARMVPTARLERAHDPAS